MKTTIQITTETGDKLRAAAPRFGLVASDRREIVAPGIEALRLDPFAAAKLEAMRKRAKVSAEVMIRRLIGKV
jgi:hypothetical protein